MESILSTALGVLIVLCLLLMRRIKKLEDNNFDLNEKLNLSKTRISESWYSEEKEKRMNIIGQNGNEGTHYEIPEIGTKEFNDLCSVMFGGKPKK